MTTPAAVNVDRYVVSCLDMSHPEWPMFSIFVVYRRNLGGWIVSDGVSPLDASGWPVFPSVAPREVLEACVFASPVEALAAADPIARGRTVAGRSVADVIRENAGGQP